MSDYGHLLLLSRCERRAIELYYAAPPDKLAGECRAELVAEFGEDVVKEMLSKGIGNNRPPLMEIKHDEMVRSLVKSGAKIAEELTADDANLWHLATGISGEAGELLDAVKKHVIYRKPLDRENVLEELGDLEFYMEGLRQGLGITREECLDANIAKLGKRYEGLVYSDSAAHVRADKQD